MFERSRASNTPSEVLRLLERLGIGRYDPWVWMKTEPWRIPEWPCFRVQDGGPRRYLPLSDAYALAFDDYSLEMFGVRVTDAAGPYYGLRYSWERRHVDVRFVRIRWQTSALSVEYTATTRERDMAIRGTHLRHDAEDRRRAWAAVELVVEGLQPGRPSGSKPGSKQEFWRARVKLIGETAARAEYYATEPRAPGRYRWWDSNILRWMRPQKHH